MPSMSRPSSDSPVPVVVIGLGKLGNGVVEALVERADVRIVAAVDIDPRRLGKDVGKLVGRAAIGVSVSDRVPDAPDGGVAMVMTGSRMRELHPVLLSLIESGYDVLTSAEELVYPWHEFPRESLALDLAARQAGRRVLGAGANPGFLMDLLPIVLSLSTRGLLRLHATRALDLRPHRANRLMRFVWASRSRASGVSGQRCFLGTSGFASRSTRWQTLSDGPSIAWTSYGPSRLSFSLSPATAST